MAADSELNPQRNYLTLQHQPLPIYKSQIIPSQVHNDRDNELPTEIKIPEEFDWVGEVGAHRCGATRFQDPAEHIERRQQATTILTRELRSEWERLGRINCQREGIWLRNYKYIDLKDNASPEKYPYFPSYLTAFIVVSSIKLDFRGDTQHLEEVIESSTVEANVKFGPSLYQWQPQAGQARRQRLKPESVQGMP